MTAAPRETTIYELGLLSWLKRLRSTIFLTGLWLQFVEGLPQGLTFYCN